VLVLQALSNRYTKNINTGQKIIQVLALLFLCVGFPLKTKKLPRVSTHLVALRIDAPSLRLVA
jgi:hypothetical protein